MQQALSNPLLVAPIQAAGVAHGGKAVSQRFLNLAGDLEEANRQRSAALLGDVADDALYAESKSTGQRRSSSTPSSRHIQLKS
jgi:hypothetical protein